MRQNLSVQSLVDALAAAIRDRILTGEIPAGALLTELEVSTSYDVARPTAKAALERLVYEGLLRRSMNKTARVPLMSVDDIRDLYYCRGLVEREVVGALAEAGTVPSGAAVALEQLRAASKGELLVTTIVEADVAFHRALVDALASPRLTRCYLAVIGEAHLCMAQVQTHHLLHPAVIAAEHDGILDAIRRRDEPRARQSLSDHLDRACRQLSSYVRDRASDPADGDGPTADDGAEARNHQPSRAGSRASGCSSSARRSSRRRQP